MPDAREQTWYTAPTYTETTNTGVAQMRINDSGLQVGTVSGTAAAELEIDIRATGNVGLQIGAISGQTANLLECLAAADGFVVDSAGIPHIPVRTDANRGAAGTAGRMIFNTTSGMPEWDDGTNWVDATGATT